MYMKNIEGIFPMKSPKPAPSSLAYFHDQKGNWTDPAEEIVEGVDSPKQVQASEVRKEYLEGRESVAEELKLTRNLIKIVKDDPKAVNMLGDLVNNCIAYYEAIAKLDHTKKSNLGNDVDIYQMEVKAADAFRTSKHTVLIADLARLRRYVMENYGPDGKIEVHDEKELPPTVLFTGDFLQYADQKRTDRARRKAVGLWALREAEAVDQMDKKELPWLNASKPPELPPRNPFSSIEEVA